MPIDKLLDCGAQVAAAITAAHERGIVHRDIKPENIMVTGSGFYKVLDFGVARIDEPTPQDDKGLSNTQTPTRWLTRRGMLMGTVAYMSPEQVQGESADPRSDIFALGSVLYELATGCSAFARGSEVATLHAIAYEEPKALRELRPEIPYGLALVISKCMGFEANSTMFGVAFDEHQRGRMYCATNGGQVFGSLDRGESWSAYPLPEGATQVYALACG